MDGNVVSMSSSKSLRTVVGNDPAASALRARDRHVLNESREGSGMMPYVGTPNEQHSPLLNARGFPMAACHIGARSFVGIPCHHSRRSCEFRCTTVQSGTISRSQIPIDSSIRLSRAIRLSNNAFRRFSSAAVPTLSRKCSCAAMEHRLSQYN